MGHAVRGARVAPSIPHPNPEYFRGPTAAPRFLRRSSRIGCGMDDAWDGGNAQLRMRSEKSAPVPIAKRIGTRKLFSDADGQSASIREKAASGDDALGSAACPEVAEQAIRLADC